MLSGSSCFMLFVTISLVPEGTTRALRRYEVRMLVCRESLAHIKRAPLSGPSCQLQSVFSSGQPFFLNRTTGGLVTLPAGQTHNILPVVFQSGHAASPRIFLCSYKKAKGLFVCAHSFSPSLPVRHHC